MSYFRDGRSTALRGKIIVAEVDTGMAGLAERGRI